MRCYRTTCRWPSPWGGCGWSSDQLRAVLRQFIFAFLAVLSFRCVTAEISNSVPTLVVRQYPDYPTARGSRFPGGLIAALWSDGRMIRPTGSNTVGKSYVEGMVSASDLDKFFGFFTNSVALRNQTADGEGIAFHAAYQVITVRRDGKRFRWMRPLPDRKAGFYKVEEGLWNLPLQAERPVDPRAFERSSWNE